MIKYILIRQKLSCCEAIKYKYHITSFFRHVVGAELPGFQHFSSRPIFFKLILIQAKLDVEAFVMAPQRKQLEKGKKIQGNYH